MASTLIGFAVALSGVVWVVVVWLVAVAWRDDLRHDDIEVRSGPRMTPPADRRLRRDIPTTADRVEALVDTPPVAPPPPVERPAPMVEVLDSESGAWERLITLHRAENAGSE